MDLRYPHTLAPPPRVWDTAPPPPPRLCACGNAIGDGDYASGHRQCAICRRLPRQRARRY